MNATAMFAAIAECQSSVGRSARRWLPPIRTLCAEDARIRFAIRRCSRCGLSMTTLFRIPMAGQTTSKTWLSHALPATSPSGITPLQSLCCLTLGCASLSGTLGMA